MSAIYGAIDLSRKKINEKLPEDFYREYKDCKIDRWGHVNSNNVFMSCAVQFFYKRAENEMLPLKENNGSLIMTADCVLDNYRELIKELDLSPKKADGDVIFAAYKKWGKECVSHLKGLFAFVIYDTVKNEIFAAVDQFSQRCLFYHIRDGIFYFSTLFFPLLNATKLGFEENERWLVDTVSLRSPSMMTEPVESAAKGVFKIESGTYIIVNKEENVSVLKKRYYSPKDSIKVDWSVTLEKSEKMIKELMADITEKILWQQDNVAAELSSGLDSSTVACNAALHLSKKNGKVYSFTAVPTKEAKIKNTKHMLYDETEGVQSICGAYPNISPTFVECGDKDYLLHADEIIKIWELPCKSQQNAIWTDEIAKKASEKGCKILLNGATGNTTISVGNYCNVAYYYFKKMQLIKAYHMFDAFKNAGISRKRLIKALFKDVIDYYLWYISPHKKDCYLNNLTKRKVGEKNSLSARFRKNQMHYFPFDSFERIHEEMYMPVANAQMGELDTKTSLKYGVLPRDPMRTTEMLNLCMSLPIYCFADDKYDRRLVRVGMKDIVPKPIREDVFRRGRQSGDNTFRVSRSWREVREKWLASVYSEDVLHYVEKDKLDEFVKRIDGRIDEAEPIDILQISDLYSFALYIKMLKKNSNIISKTS